MPACALRTLTVAPLIIAIAACSSATDPRASANVRPEDARIITADIPRFWAAFDRTTSISDTAAIRVQYLDSGTVGLKDFTDKRWKDAKTLVSMFWPIRSYYASIRQNTLGIPALEPQIRAAFAKLETIYPEGVYPNVYFALGGMSTGGTTSANGLLIGSELFSRAADSPTAALTPWQKANAMTINLLPAVVSHELTHFQQKYNIGETLLGWSIMEGSADFVGELLANRTINEPLRAYGDAHEAAIWAEFSGQMNGTDRSKWLYNGGDVTATSTRPADLGYYVGYRITQAYYNKQTDKHQALLDILHIGNFPEFLQKSGYGPTS